LGLKREDRPAAFAGLSESGFRSSCCRDTVAAYTSEYPILRAPPRQPSSATQAGKEADKPYGQYAETIGAKERDRLHQAIASLRILKPGGRFEVSDVVVRGEAPAEVRKSMELWVGCFAGALEEMDYVKAH
jgi:hypothetical protein